MELQNPIYNFLGVHFALIDFEFPLSFVAPTNDSCSPRCPGRRSLSKSSGVIRVFVGGLLGLWR